MEEKIYIQDSVSKFYKLKEDFKRNPNLKLRYINRTYEAVHEFIVDSDDNIRYYKGIYFIFFSSKGEPFLKKRDSVSFSFNKNTNKITNYKSNFKLLNHVITIISQRLNTEWFINYTQSQTYTGIPINIMYNKTILEKVWGKKITNPDMLFKFLQKNILRINNISTSALKLFLRRPYFFCPHYTQFIKYIDLFVVNPDLFISKLYDMSVNREVSLINDYVDYIHQCVSLNIKSNVAIWSRKRFVSEHNKLSEMLIQYELDDKSQILLYPDSYNELLPKNISCRFVNSEQLCFKESKLMHHCLYSNYWNRIKRLEYFAISINDKKFGNATVGIKVTNDNKQKFVVEQIRGVRNSEVDSTLCDIFTLFVNNNQELFSEIIKNHANTNVEYITKPNELIQEFDDGELVAEFAELF